MQPGDMTIREVDANLEDQAFAEAVVESCLVVFPRNNQGT